MKKLVLIAVIICVGCSAHFNVGLQCLDCNKPKAKYSIGYCKKHYTFEKEQKLRGMLNHK